MEAVSLSSLPVASLLWQSRPGTWLLTVVCKATFELQPMESRLAPEQEPINTTDRHWSDDASWSLYAPTDLVPYRPRADVLLVGHAFASRGARVRSLVARIIVGDLDKAIKVHADRSFGQDGVLQDGPRFSKMPLLWERAGGGPDTNNPVGMPPNARDIYGKQPVPNLQPPGVNISEAEEPIEPIGFGPIAPTWPPRRQRLNNHAATWSVNDWHLQPLPPDLDAAYFNAAPRDQQVSALRDNERIILDNLHPEHPHLVTSLPGIHPRAFVHRPGRNYQDLVMRPDQLWLNTDRCVVTMTWRGQIPLQQRNEAGVVMVALESAGQILGWAEVKRQAARGGIRIDGATDEKEVEELEELEPDAPDILDGDTFTSGAFTSGGGLADGHKTRPAALQRAVGPSILPFTSPQSQMPPTLPSDPAQRFSAMPFVAAGQGAQQQPGPPSLQSPPRMSMPLGTTTLVPPLATGKGPAPLTITPPIPTPSPSPPATGLGSAPPPVPPTAPSTSPSSPPVRSPSPSIPPASGGTMPPPATRLASVATPPAPALAPSAAPSTLGVPPVAQPLPPPIVGAPAVPPPALIRAPVLGAAAGGMSAGVLAASNAAAGSTPSLPRDEPAPASTKTPAVQASARPAPTSKDVLDLIWFEPQCVARVRRPQAWKEILKELAKKPIDRQVDDPGQGQDAAGIEDRRDVFEILSRGGAVDALGVREALSDAVRDHAKFTPPLRLLEGELSFPFDEVESLKTTIAVVTPLIGTDETLKAAVNNAQEAQRGSDLRSAPAVAESLTTRIREVWNLGKRSTPAGYLENQTERALIAERHYQRRKILGGRFVRAILQPFGPDELIPAYLPDAVADLLPLFPRLKVRLIAELHLQIDPSEAHSAAVKVLALARNVPLFGKPR
ncbi:DUF2169 family type VI secretion system accessory protein [Chondromyces crocatus]|uniref:DUF2169 domain-containing protein n=1 Tax=Chondromyces crocatus TaxID=52 RepID=A0A0K1E9Q1_CHOCO|nr:DUF2169 domain-containing protein [Chondromyces crocatus]AKT37590.1 uncharacterized protein CMC5_017310 [Chondromyces crocatus]